MSSPRSPGVPGLLPQTYAQNDTSVKAPRVLPSSLATVFCELRGERVFIGHKLGDSRHAETSFSFAEFIALVHQLRAVVAQTKETP
jgi:hypothetical protein